MSNRTSRTLFISDLTDRSGGRIQANHVFVAAAGQQLAIGGLRGANRFGLGGGVGGGALAVPTKGDANFVVILGLLDRGMDQHGQQDNRAQRNDPLHLAA